MTKCALLPDEEFGGFGGNTSLKVVDQHWDVNCRTNIQPIKYIEKELLKQITNDLKHHFHVNLDLTKIRPNTIPTPKNIMDQYIQMESIFDNSTILDTFTKTNNKLTFYNSYTKQSEIFTIQPGTESKGGYNTINKYTSDIDISKIYIFREANPGGNNTPFNCFYENLKHLILYIIMCRYNNKNKIIPKPIGIGAITGTNKIGFLSEAGDMDLSIYINNFGQMKILSNIKKILFGIYEGLYNLNNIPNFPNLQFQHCDMKTSNIVILNHYSEDPYPLIIDFGFSIFKLDKIYFVVNGEMPYFNKFVDDPFYNTIIDFLTLLYSMKTTQFIRSIFNIQSSLNTTIFDKIIDIIYDVNIQTISELYKIKSQSFYIYIEQTKGYIDKSPIITKYNYNILPAELKQRMGIDTKRRFYIKYLKYKQKYLQLQKEINKY